MSNDQASSLIAAILTLAYVSSDKKLEDIVRLYKGFGGKVDER